jgi:hypothetical protein
VHSTGRCNTSDINPLLKGGVYGPREAVLPLFVVRFENFLSRQTRDTAFRSIKSGVLISGSDSTTGHAVNLYNRLQMLKTQKLHLDEKRTLFISDDDLEKTILVFRNESERVQNCLRNVALLSSVDTR